jgi:hypothetical protein
MPLSLRYTATGVDLLMVPLTRPGNFSSGPNRALASAAVLVAANFSRCADTIGLSRSLAQLYATIFLSKEPLAFKEFVVRSSLSKGSASTGCLHGVERVRVANVRHSFYQAQLSLPRLLSAFVSQSLASGLMVGARFLDNTLSLAEDCPHSDHFKARLQSLVTWYDRASKILPMLAVVASPSSDD